MKTWYDPVRSSIANDKKYTPYTTFIYFFSIERKRGGDGD